MKRRDFLKYSLATSTALILKQNIPSNVAKAATLQIEPQVSGLALHSSLSETSVWSFAAKGSPELRFKQGDKASIRVLNSLKEGVSVHWHGLRVPNAMDGVANLTQDPIKSGDLFDYEFDLLDAGTYWYHTHSNSQEQLGRGLAGAFIIEETNPPDVDYDVALLMQDWRLNQQGQIENDFNSMRDLAHDGRLGNAVSVNSQIQPSFEFFESSRVRLRFINASTARFYKPQLPESWNAWLISKDGQAVTVNPYSPTLLGPGMRVDVIADVQAGQFEVIDTAYQPYLLLQLRSQASQQELRDFVPEAVTPNPIALASADSQHLELILAGGAMSGMMGMGGGNIWKLNNKSLSENLKNTKPMFMLEQNKSYTMTIKNKTSFAHPMHMHGHTFQILTDNESRLSDTLLLLPNEEKDISFVADNVGDWLIHCHVLGHQASGMMAVMKVV